MPAEKVVRRKRNPAKKSKEKWTDADRRRFLKYLLQEHGSISHAARFMGVKQPHSTIAKWRKEHPWFDRRFQEIQDEIFDKIERNMFRLAADEDDSLLTNPQAVIARKFLLSYHAEGRKRGYRPRGEISGPNGGPIPVKSFQQLVEEADDEDEV